MSTPWGPDATDQDYLRAAKEGTMSAPYGSPAYNREVRLENACKVEECRPTHSCGGKGVAIIEGQLSIGWYRCRSCGKEFKGPTR